ncbi:MAG: apolipoprotein N-acyltransferase [bacterium]|nr:apolipoprotein N-acyltransferase [bacterium]
MTEIHNISNSNSENSSAPSETNTALGTANSAESTEIKPSATDGKEPSAGANSTPDAEAAASDAPSAQATPEEGETAAANDAPSAKAAESDALAAQAAPEAAPAMKAPTEAAPSAEAAASDAPSAQAKPAAATCKADGKTCKPDKSCACNCPFQHPVVVSSVLAAISAVLLALCFPFACQDWLVWVALVPLFAALRFKDVTLKRGLLLGIIFGYIYNAISLYWLDTFGPIAQYGAALVRCFWPAIGCMCIASTRFKKPWQDVLFICAGWLSIEYLLSSGSLGMAWGLLANSQARHPVMLQINSIFGVWGLSFVICLVNASIAAWLRFRDKEFSVKQTLIVSIGAILAVALTVGFGFYRISHIGKELVNGMRFGIVQLAVPQEQKFDPSYAPKVLDELEKMTVKAARRRARIVIWPETSVPYAGMRKSTELLKRIGSIAKKARCPILIGSIEYAPNGGTLNTMSLFNKRGKLAGRYDKQHLVPFGEYLPLRGYWPPIPGIEQVMDYRVSNKTKPIEVNGKKIGPLICFENMVVTVPRRHVLDGANYLIVPTNDAWFGETAELVTHFELSAMRAVELGRPVIHVANTGVSGFVNAYGKILEESKINKNCVMVREMKTMKGTTFYTRMGDWLALCSVTAVAFITIFSFKRRDEDECQQGN